MKRCVAKVSDHTGYYFGRCSKAAKGQREGFPLCGIHLRVIDRHGWIGTLINKVHGDVRLTEQPASVTHREADA